MLFAKTPMPHWLIASLLAVSWTMVPLQSFAAKADKPEAVAKEEAPDAMGYMVKGPDIEMENLRDPFVSPMARIAERNKRLLAEKQAKLGKGTRKVEDLEAFDLSELKLVAVYSMGKDRVALIQDNSGKAYKVRRNSHMGKDSGRVEKISEDSVLLIESTLDPAGDLIEREVVLTLKEVNE